MLNNTYCQRKQSSISVLCFYYKSHNFPLLLKPPPVTLDAELLVSLVVPEEFLTTLHHVGGGLVPLPSECEEESGLYDAGNII